MFLKDLNKFNADMVDGKHVGNSANSIPVLDSNAKLPIDQIPTGTTSTTVSLGNHNHDGTYTKPTGTITANRVAVFNDTTGRVIKDSGYTIATSVPSGAKFTDTVYTHPNDSNTRHVTDAEKTTWNAKESTSGSQAKADAALASAKSYTDEKLAQLVASSPETLDTLNELAQALGNDANFATTVAQQIGTKADTTYVNSELAKKASSSHTHSYAGSSSAGGAANSAVKLSTARTLSATGDATGSMSFDGSKDVSMSLTLANSGVTSGSYGPSANATASFGGTISVPQVTVDSKGRVTSAGTKTITLPSNPNTDTKVTNTLNTTTKAYITGTTSASTNTGTQIFDTGVYLDTTAGKLVAATFQGSLAGNATTATKATQDSAGQQINTTYIKGLSVNGKTITYTKGDGTTGTITTQDTNTTYSTGTSTTSGLTKLYTGTGTNTDGTMTQSAIKSALDGKANSSHTHNYAGSSSAGGSANSAVKLATARTINGTSFDGSANITTANWGTARTLTIGNKGQSVNGSGNVSWSLADIGATETVAWDTSIKCATWSRLFQFASSNATTGGTFLVNIRATRSSVVYNPTLLVNFSHASVCNIVQINNTSYSNIKVRGVVDTNGAGYFEIYDNVNSATNSTAQTVSVTVTEISSGLTITKYTAFTDGTTIPTNYASKGEITTVSGTYYSGTAAKANTATSASSATKATQDSAGQQINSTYIKGLSVSGKTITYTKGDGTTGTITTQDTNTTYSAGTGMSLSGTTFNHKNSVTAGTAKGDDSKTLSWGGTFTIPTVTYDAQGHVTGKGTTTMTMPSNPNSDTKVTNTLNTTAKAYITGTTSSSTNTGTQVFDTGVYLDTTAGKLVATTFAGALSGNASSATKATQDSTGQQINTTYIKGLSVSGKTITYTKGDGTTGTITTQDTNTTYSTGTASALGLTKLYTGTGTATDGTMTQAAIKTALDGKAASSHTHNNIVSRGNVTAESGTTRPAVSGISMSQAYNNSYPTAYGNVLNLKGTGDGQILVGWSGTSGAHAPVYVRSKRDTTDANWSSWAQIYTTANKPTASEIGAAASSHTHNYAGSSSAGGAANSATKLATARTINGTNFDGSANITTANWGTTRKLNNISVNGSGDVKLPLDYYTCSVSDNNTNLYHHILASGQCTSDYTDKSITILVVNHYNGAGFGIAKATLRTNQASAGNTATGELRWLVRSGFSANQLCFNIRNTAKDTYMDIFYKSSGTYASLTWYVLSEGSRGTQASNTWTKYNTNASGTNAYTEANMKTIRSYTSTLQSAADHGHVSSATTASTCTGNAATATTLQTARTINGTSFNGSANITTANWGTARTITIGSSGKSVNGSGNVSWSLSEIGAAAASHTHSYLPLSGGTLTGRLTATGKISVPTTGSSWISGMTLTNAPLAITTQQSTSSYHPILAVKTSGGHVANIGGLGDNFGFYGFKTGRTENATDWSFVFNASSGDATTTGKITASKGFSGALSGNATTATTLATARTINGTSFNGSANITTANWGTARTITIGSTGKSVNGSGNVSWSLSEIGAAASSHTHSDLSNAINELRNELGTNKTALENNINSINKIL